MREIVYGIWDIFSLNDPGWASRVLAFRGITKGFLAGSPFCPGVPGSQKVPR